MRVRRWKVRTTYGIALLTLLLASVGSTDLLWAANPGKKSSGATDSARGPSSPRSPSPDRTVCCARSPAHPVRQPSSGPTLSPGIRMSC